MKSKYLERFKRLQAEGSELFELIGDVIIVEKITPPEAKTASGLIIASHDKMANGFGQNRPVFCHVLLVGQGYYDEESGTSTPLNVQPGDIVMVGTQSVREMHEFGPIIVDKEAVLGVTREEEIQLRIKGPDAYLTMCELLKAYVV